MFWHLNKDHTISQYEAYFLVIKKKKKIDGGEAAVLYRAAQESLYGEGPEGKGRAGHAHIRRKIFQEEKAASA